MPFKVYVRGVANCTRAVVCSFWRRTSRFEVSKLQRWLKSWKKLLVASFLEILVVGMDFINAGPD